MAKRKSLYPKMSRNLKILTRWTSNGSPLLMWNELPSLYEGWVSLERQIEHRFKQQDCVLEKMPEDVAKLVVKNIVEQSLPQHIHERSNIDLNSEKEVRWMMEVICYGLSLPLSENETIRSCMTIYANWFKVVLPPSDQTVHIPAVIREDPNRYACDMLVHLYRIFVPRKLEQNYETQKQMERHAVVCHQVLRLVETAAKQHAATLSPHTWDFILQFLLAVNDALLAPPTEGIVFQGLLRPDSTEENKKGKATASSNSTNSSTANVGASNVSSASNTVSSNSGLAHSHHEGSGSTPVGHASFSGCSTDAWNLSEQMAPRVLSVIFEVWLLSCHYSFPRPPLWRTFHDMCRNWRHHRVLVMQWQRVNLALTDRVLRNMYGNDFPHISGVDRNIVPSEMTKECVSECWIRFLNLLGNPVDLCHPSLISSTPAFLDLAMAADAKDYDSSVKFFPCLRQLPDIFLQAMRGIAVLADAFLGLSPSPVALSQSRPSSPSQNSTSGISTASAHASAASVNSNPQAAATTAAPATVTSADKSPQSQRKPKSISASSLADKTKAAGKQGKLGNVQWSNTNMSGNVSSGQTMNTVGIPAATPTSAPLSTFTDTANNSGNVNDGWLSLDMIPSPSVLSSRPHGNSILHLLGHWLFEAAVAGVHLASPNKAGQTPDALISARSTNVDPISYELGRAEACGALVRIFTCSRPDFLQLYLARFYICLYYGLRIDKEKSPQVLATIVFYSANLLRVDLQGANVLVPRLLSAVELILGEEERNRLKIPDYMSHVQLRRASIHLLLSMICLPLQYNNAHVKDLLPVLNDVEEQVTFISLKKRLCDRLYHALCYEKDSTNTQMLLGGIQLLIEDMAFAENSEIQQQDETSGLSNTDTTSGLFNHTVSLICNRLLGEWKKCNDTALSAMEVLCGLSKVKLSQTNRAMCKRTVRWICDFICQQCTRPPCDHSRTLHSIIVAAFQCLSLWLVHHAYLLHDKECLHCILETIELGISGRKSQNKRSDQPVLKADKHATPASRRVKDAAEAVLSTVMDLAGAFPNPMGGLESQVKEETLLRSCSRVPDRSGNAAENIHFRYFGVETGLILALLEEPLVGNREEPLPAVNMIVRGPFGRHAWSLQLRQRIPSDAGCSSTTLGTPERPSVALTPPKTKADLEDGAVRRPTPKFFPEAVEKVAKTSADSVIPSLETLAKRDSVEREEIDLLKAAISSQTVAERQISEKVAKEHIERPFPNPDTECKQPCPFHGYQTSRLFLLHIGFLPMFDRARMGSPEEVTTPPEASSDDSSSSPVKLPALFHIDSSTRHFYDQLDNLDALPVRTTDLAYIYWQRNGQYSTEEIMKNDWRTCPQLIRFLDGLGNRTVDQPEVREWSDSATEVKFIVCDRNIQLERCRSASEIINLLGTSTGSSGHSDLQSITSGSSIGGRSSTGLEERLARVGVVWLEHFNDLTRFPANELILPTTGVMPPHVIFIHPLRQKGLYRVHLNPSNVQGSWAFKAGPLVSGMVVSRRCLPSFVRQTVVNIHRRHRLQDADVFQPPHVRRNQKIHDILSRSAQTHLDMPDLYTNLLHEPMAHLEPRF